MDHRRHSPAAERNTPFILAELQRLLPARGGLLLEIASGTGQHAAALSAGLPGWDWQPSDFDAAALPSIAAWCEGLDRVRTPVRLDVLAPGWPEAPPRVDAIFCANMIHISPWACTVALLQGAARALAPGGLLITYGPYFVDGVETAPSNLAFDADLRARDPAWGLRRLAAIEAEAALVGLRLREQIAMPANNRLLAWAQAEAPSEAK
jgi:SAM-dependent methyltransferase